MTEANPARRRQRATQILRHANADIDEALTAYRDLVNKHRSVVQTLLSLVPADLVGSILPAMAVEGVDWTTDAYDEIDRVCVEFFAPVHSQVEQAETQLTRERQRREQLMLRTERIHRSLASVKGRITRKELEIVASESRLKVKQGELAKRKDAFLSFIFKPQKEEHAVAEEMRTRERLQSEKLELESKRTDLERDRDDPEHPASFAATETRIAEIVQKLTELDSQIRNLESQLETILIQPYHKQIQRMRESHDECRTTLVTALRRFSTLSVKQTVDQSFESWLVDCLERRDEMSVLIRAETATLDDRAKVKQEKAIESLTKARQREIDREQAKKDRRRAEREQRRKAVERREAAAARRRAHQPTTFEPDLNELRDRLT